MLRKPASALLIDLDGVVRRWDPAVVAEVEKNHGLAAGLLLETAFEWPRLRAVVSGTATHEQWLAEIAEVLAEPAGGLAHARTAVSEWQAYRGEVDADTLDLVRDVRAAGLPVGLATNGTDRLDADLAGLGLADEFDVIVNSSQLGIHKPAPEFFARACDAVGQPPDMVLFIDDEDRVIRAARAAKLLAYRWTGPEGLGYIRAALAMQARPASQVTDAVEQVASPRSS